MGSVGFGDVFARDRVQRCEIDADGKPHDEWSLAWTFSATMRRPKTNCPAPLLKSVGAGQSAIRTVRA
jgi:hypothetical protein